MGRHTGEKVVDPLTKEEQPEIIYDIKETFHRRSMSTQDYKRYLQAKNQLAKETDEEKRIDLTLRMYEYLALKFLGMTHEQFVNADFDDVVVATLACDVLFGMGDTTTTTTTPQSPQQALVRRRPSSGNNNNRYHYKAPDEE